MPKRLTARKMLDLAAAEFEATAKGNPVLTTVEILEVLQRAGMSLTEARGVLEKFKKDYPNSWWVVPDVTH